MTGVELVPDAVAQIEQRLTELRAQREGASVEQRRAAEHLARATAEGEPEPERKRLRTAQARATDEVLELDAAIVLLDRELGPAREAARQSAILNAETAAVSAAKAYAVTVRAVEAKLMKWLQSEFVPAYDRMQAALASAGEAHVTAIRAAGERQQDHPFDERPQARALPMDRAQTFFYLARRLARAGGSARVPEPVNRCSECGTERQ